MTHLADIASGLIFRPILVRKRIMKASLAASIILIASSMDQAFACPTTGLATRADIGKLLSYRYACATVGGQSWNQLHMGSGFGPSSIQDYKRGPQDQADPSRVVGTYTINSGSSGNPDTITYDYGTGGSSTYVVTPAAQAPGPYSFCNVSTGETITVSVSDRHC